MTPVRARAIFTLIAVSLAACTAHRTPAAGGSRGHPLSLELAGQFVMIRPGVTDPLDRARFGGVSGLAMDRATNELLGICDDSADSRVFVFRTSGEGPAFRVDLAAYFPLPAGADPPATLDAEAIAVTRGGRLFVASEGSGTREPREPPAITEYARRVDYIGRLLVPAKFIPPATGPITRGVRGNAAFESLSLTPDETRLYTATETALAQDGEPATTRAGTLSRILEYGAEGATFVPRREFAYPVEPLPDPGFSPALFINGVVELLALGNSYLLAMERGYAEEGSGSGRRMNRIRIFRVSLEGATDISALDSLRGRTGIQPVRKTLVLDLATVPGIEKDRPAVDNFEGMAFGPPLADGTRSLLLVADDNFNVQQRTVFLLFRMVEPSAAR